MGGCPRLAPCKGTQGICSPTLTFRGSCPSCLLPSIFGALSPCLALQVISSYPLGVMPTSLTPQSSCSCFWDYSGHPSPRDSSQQS